MLSFVCVVGFKNSLVHAKTPAQCDAMCQLAADKMWRTIVAFGCLPALLALYFRLTIPETPRYTMDITLDIEKAQADADAYLHGEREGDANVTNRDLVVARQRANGSTATWTEFWRHFRQWRYGKILLGTAGSWFFIDIAFWGLGLNNSSILKAIGYAGSTNVYYSLYDVAVGNLILSVAGNIPGYWVSVATIDTLGRKPIQMASFIILTILFAVIGFAYHKISSHGLFALYVLCQFFSNFGANSTTFVGMLKSGITSRNTENTNTDMITHSAGRSIPHPFPFHGSWYLCCYRQSRGRDCASSRWSLGEQRW